MSTVTPLSANGCVSPDLIMFTLRTSSIEISFADGRAGNAENLPGAGGSGLSRSGAWQSFNSALAKASISQ